MHFHEQLANPYHASTSENAKHRLCLATMKGYQRLRAENRLAEIVDQVVYEGHFAGFGLFGSSQPEAGICSNLLLLR